jgi:hypothetical protein
MLYGFVADRLKGSPQIRKYLLKMGITIGYSETRTLTILKKNTLTVKKYFGEKPSTT